MNRQELAAFRMRVLRAAREDLVAEGLFLAHVLSDPALPSGIRADARSELALIRIRLNELDQHQETPAGATLVERLARIMTTQRVFVVWGGGTWREMTIAEYLRLPADTVAHTRVFETRHELQAYCRSASQSTPIN